jgi:hypothetical protein
MSDLIYYVVSFLFLCLVGWLGRAAMRRHDRIAARAVCDEMNAADLRRARAGAEGERPAESSSRALHLRY